MNLKQKLLIKFNRKIFRTLKNFTLFIARKIYYFILIIIIDFCIPKILILTSMENVSHINNLTYKPNDKE